MRSLVAVVLLALASPAFAAEPALGPEAPISLPTFDAAAGDQRSPSLVWYGDSIAAAWIDTRNNFPSLRIAQLDALGRPKTIATRISGPQSDVRLASSGAATPLLATLGSGTTYVGPAGVSGRSVSGRLADLVTDGTTYLLLTVDSSVSAEILDARGDRVRVLRFGTNVGTSAVAVPFDGAYHVIYTEGNSIRDAAIGTDGTVVDQILSTMAPGTSIAAAAAGDALLIAWTSARGIELMQLTPNRVGAARATFDASAEQLFVGSDGSRFLLAWTDGTALRAARFSAEGAMESEPFTIGSALADDLTFVRTPAGVVMAWSDGNPANVFTRGAASFAGIADAQNALASVGYTQQQDISLPNAVVWSEGEGGARIQSLDGVIADAEPGHALRNPVAVRGAGTILHAWRDIASDGSSRVIAKVGNDEPMVIAEGDSLRDFDVAFDGASFFVVWTDGELHVTRVAPSGVRLETTFIESTGRVSSLRAARIKNELAVVFVDGTSLVYSGDARRPIVVAAVPPSRPAIALDDRGEPLIVWTSSTCLFAARRIGEGFFVARTLVCEKGTLGAPAVAWSGSELVLAWDELAQHGYHTVRAMRIGRDGETIDATPFDLTGVFRDSIAPSLAPSSTGVVIGYQRVAGEEPFDDVSRIFTRTLARLNAVRRSRNIGH